MKGKFDRKILEGLIFQYLLDNFEHYHLFRGNRDRWADFVSWLYPRLSRAVDYYRETGTSFDTYINSIIQWSSREYKAREAEHYITELVCWRARAEEMDVHSPEPQYLDEPAKTKKPLIPLSGLSHRQVLILFLKSYYYITGKFLEKVAVTIGMKKEKLQKMVDRLHDLRARNEENFHSHQERLFSQYYRCLAFQERLLTALPGTARYQKMEEYSDRARLRYAAMKERFGKIRTDATNRQISVILDIPKGTVDSALHSVREKLKTTSKYHAVRVPSVVIPVEKNRDDRYHGLCSATGTVSMQAIPQMS